MTNTQLLPIGIALAILAVVLTFLYAQGPQFDPEAVRGVRVLVTGASSGIGEQLAYQYARHGASVFCHRPATAASRQVVEKCKELGVPNASFGHLAADMGNMSHTTPVIQAAVDRLGGLDHMILNHAYIPNMKVFTNTQESFDTLQKALDVNMRSFAHLAIEALPHLQKTNGSLTAVSSVAGKLGVPLLTSYGASKFALDGFFSAFRQEVRKFNVSVSLAVLGGIGTERLGEIMSDLHDTNKGKVSIKDLKDTMFAPASPDACALEIMRGTTMREREIYFPPTQYIRYLVMFREVIVRLGDWNIGLLKLLN